MVFSSITFLFFFLPLVLAAYFFPGNRFRNATLLAASLLSYAWGEKGTVLVLLLTILMNALFGFGFLALDRKHDDQDREAGSTRQGRMALTCAGRRKGLLVVGVCANLALLFYYKYFHWLITEVVPFLPGRTWDIMTVNDIHTPIGISFFIFHALSYLVDVYRREAPAQKHPLNLALYMAVFPKMLAGPILPYHEGYSQLQNRTIGAEAFLAGVERFIVGLAKKMLLATPLAGAADKIFAIPASGLSADVAWLGIVCYTLQIYYDFSGYTDMAVGLGSLFGFRFPENFSHPYVSRSLREFWRRWHISLSQWFRDYLYIPLGGNRCSREREYLNLAVVFFLCGLWHGASWNFVIWGLWHGIFLVLERTRRMTALLDATWRPLQHLYGLLLVTLGWVFFRCETLPEALSFLKALFGFGAPLNHEFTLELYFNSEVALAMTIGTLAAFPWGREATVIVAQSPGPSHAQGEEWSRIISVARCILFGTLFLLSCMALAGGTHNPFIYFQF